MFYDHGLFSTCLQVQSLIATPLRTGARVIGSVGSAVGSVPNNMLQSVNRLGKTMLGC